MEHTREGILELRAHAEHLEQRVQQLQKALESRTIIEQAKGAVSARYRTTPAEAFEFIRRLARNQRRSIHDFSAEVVAAHGKLPTPHG